MPDSGPAAARLLDALRRIVGDGQVLADPGQTESYLTDWRGRYRGRALGVVRPGSVEELAAVVALCHRRRVPMVPQGGNTGLCGGATPDGTGSQVVISAARLDRIRDLDTANMTITVEAGCTLAAVQHAAAEVGCLFPLSLAAEGSCQIGGNLATNAGGVHVLKFGTARDLVLGIEAVLPDGRVWNGLRGLRKNNTGYDLKQLFIGGEGTLGFISAAVLKLFPAAPGRAVAWVATASAEQAIGLLSLARRQVGGRLNAYELIGRTALELVLAHIPGSRAPLDPPAPWNVLIELADATPRESLESMLETLLADAFTDGLVADAVLARSEAQAGALWRLREDISEAQRIEGLSIKHDIAVPVSRVAEFLERAGGEVAQRFPGLRVVAFGHLGDGNLHYNLSMADPRSNAGLIARSAEVNRCVHDLAVGLGGTISAEHGLGQLKREEMLKYRDPLETELMRRIKRAFDPLDLMNPGKLI